MDICVDCKRPLRDSVCSSCYQIFVPEVKKEDICWNCGKRMLLPLNIFSRIRFRCGFCSYNYFSLKHYNPEMITFLEEELSILEVVCEQCGKEVPLDVRTQELICRNCGLVHDHPVFLDI